MAVEENQKNVVKDNSVVKISDDNMRVFINLCPLTSDLEYSMVELNEMLFANKVVYGIDVNKLKEMIEKKLYYQDIQVAEGMPCINGTDGYFEFLFNTVVDKKPKILEDGSVDYSSIGDFEVVEAGAEIVRYHVATKGENGINVKGMAIYCKNGKELVPLKGKGFNLSEDKQIYTASVTGKVEYKSGKLNVSNLLVINDDITHATGNVEFSGDVQIKGGIYTGMIVKAYGNISVDGHVEGAEIIAGKDVILKGGMQGAGKGKVIAGGSVSGKFFEQAVIQCKENLNANAILNCEVVSDGEVIISGKLGIIIGGSVFAKKGISATIIGNLSELKTKLIIGSDKDLVPEIMKIDNEIDLLSKEVQKLNHGIEQMNQLIEKSKKQDLVDKKLYLVRAKISKESELFAANGRKEELVADLDKAVHSKLVIRKSIYPGVRINMNGYLKNIIQEDYNVTYQNRGMEIIAVPNV